MNKFFNNLLNKINKKEKIMKGKKVKLVASKSKTSTNRHRGNGKVYTVGESSEQPQAWYVYDSFGENCGWAYECEMVVFNLGMKELEKELSDAKTNLDTVQLKIDWMKETGSENFSEDEFKVYQTLKLLDDGKLSMIEKSRLIAELIKK